MEKMSGRTGQVAQRSVLSLPDLVAELETEEQDCFRRLFVVDTTVGELVLPPHMVSWVERYFGSAEAVVRQKVVKVTDRWTLDATLFNELRDTIFARVAERAGRRVALRTYEHLFALSLRWHLERRTGELARAISRGVQAVGFMLHTALFTMGPVVLELGLVLGILLWRYPPSFAFVTLATVAVYAAFTIATTEWRTKFRREMNEKDNEFSAQAVDGLLNYEIVKAFGNEAFEARRLDRAHLLGLPPHSPRHVGEEGQHQQNDQGHGIESRCEYQSQRHTKSYQRQRFQ